MKRDYMVTTPKTDERLFTTIKEAKAEARELSKEYGEAKINRWIKQDDYSDYEFDEHFEIKYKNGKEEK